MFATTLAFFMAIWLTACGSIDTQPHAYPVYPGPQNVPEISASSRVEPNWSGSIPGESGDPSSSGAQPSMEELGAADTDGGTTDEEPPLHPNNLIQTLPPQPYPQGKKLAWDDSEYEHEYEINGDDDPENGPSWKGDDGETIEEPFWEDEPGGEESLAEEAWQEAMEF